MADDRTPTTARRQVGARLRALRLARALTAAQVKEELGFSVSKISRMESGARAVSEEDLAVLIEYYGARGDEARELQEAARAGRRRREPWVGVTTTEGHFQQFVQSGFVELERDAEFIREFHAGVVPGLLQTEDYVRALMEAAAPAEEELRERAIAHRLARQRLLDRPGRYAVIIDEAVLAREIGGAGTMADQLDALLRRGRAGAADVRVVPFGRGYHPGVLGAFAALSMGPGLGGDLVFVEGMVGFEQYGGDDVARFDRVWDQLLVCAMSSSESFDLIARHRDRYRQTLER